MTTILSQYFVWSGIVKRATPFPWSLKHLLVYAIHSVFCNVGCSPLRVHYINLK